MLHSQKALITGLANPNQPGSINIIIYPDYRKSFEIQTHSEPVTKMAFNYENNLLFSGSEDGSVSFMTIIDLDKRQRAATIVSVNHTTEVLVQGQLRNRLLNEIRIKSYELEEKRQENKTKLDLKKRNYNAQLQDLKNRMQIEEEKGNEEMALVKQSNEESMRAHQQEKR